MRWLILLAGLLPVSTRTQQPTASSLGIYPVFFAVQGTKSYVCPGCNSSAYTRNGSVDVAAFGLLPNNWTYIASWDSIWPTLGGENGSVPHNGGVPQAANLSAHIHAVEAAIELFGTAKKWKIDAVLRPVRVDTVHTQHLNFVHEQMFPSLGVATPTHSCLEW